MALNLWPADAVTGAPSYAGRMLRQLVGAVWSSDQSRPDGGRSGILPATPSNVCTITGTGPYTWNIGVHRGVLDKEASAVAGTYTYDLDAPWTGTVAAADLTNHRIDLISIQLSDPAEGDGTSAPAGLPVYTNGVAATTPVAPSPPNSRCMPFAQINSPQSGGGAPVITLVAPYTTAVGGIIPCRSSAEYPASPYEGQYVDNAALNMKMRFDGSVWVPAGYISANATPGAVTVAARKSLTIIPASGSQVAWTISGWASAPVVQLTLESAFAWIWRISAVTSTQINAFIITNTGTNLPDSTAITMHATLTGIPTAGVVPVV